MSRKIPQNSVQIEFAAGMAVGFDMDAFDDLITAHGVEFVHWRAMACPVGKIDKNDVHRPHADHSGCSNGFIYSKAGTFLASFLGNPEDSKDNDVGFLDASNAQITAKRNYEDSGKPVTFTVFDRLYLATEEVTVPFWETLEVSQTGRDKLKFPPVEVYDLMDSTGKRYNPSEYELADGYIVWKHSPGLDALQGRGLVYSVRYSYRPYWYISRLNHQIRVASVDNPITGIRETVRAPLSAAITREYVAEKEDHDIQAPDPNSLRQVKVPEDASSALGYK